MSKSIDTDPDSKQESGTPGLWVGNHTFEQLADVDKNPNNTKKYVIYAIDEAILIKDEKFDLSIADKELQKSQNLICVDECIPITGEKKIII